MPRSPQNQARVHSVTLELSDRVTNEFSVSHSAAKHIPYVTSRDCGSHMMIPSPRPSPPICSLNTQVWTSPQGGLIIARTSTVYIRPHLGHNGRREAESGCGSEGIGGVTSTLHLSGENGPAVSIPAGEMPERHRERITVPRHPMSSYLKGFCPELLIRTRIGCHGGKVVNATAAHANNLDGARKGLGAWLYARTAQVSSRRVQSGMYKHTSVLCSPERLLMLSPPCGPASAC